MTATRTSRKNHFSPTIEKLESRTLLSADLTGVFKGKIPPALLIQGSNHLTLTVTNIGDAAAKGAVTVSLYASTDMTLDGGDTLLFTSPSKRVNLKPTTGKSNLALRFPSPIGLADGSYFILANITPGVTIADGNLANNVVPTPGTVSIRKAFVDLTGAVVQAPTGTISIGGKKQKPTTLAAIVTNNGNVAAKGKLAVSFYAAFNNTLDPSSTLLVTTRAQQISIPAGHSKKIIAHIKLGTNIPSGTFFVLADVNSDGGIAESDTSNNVGASSGTVIINNPLIPPGPRLVGGLESDVLAVVVGSPETVHFNATIVQATASTTVNVEEFDSAGNDLGLFTQLFDDGSQGNGDKTAGDGIYSGTNTIGFTAPGTRYFAAIVADPTLTAPVQSTTLSIPGVNTPSTMEMQTDLSDSASMNTMAHSVLNSGGSASSALSTVNSALLSDPNVQAASIAMSSHAIEWKTTDGILEGIDLDSSTGANQEGTGLGPVANSITPAASMMQRAAITPLDTTTPDPTKTAICIGPYEYGFVTEQAVPLENLLKQNGYTVTPAINSASTDSNVSIETFKNLANFGAVIIVSHGAELPKSGEAILTGIPATVSNELAYAGDLFNNRLAVMDLDGVSTLCITPKFIRTYTGAMNDSIVYVSACFSTFDDKMANAFLGTGADAYLGYSHVVDVTFAHDQGLSAFNTLLQTTKNTVSDIPGINAVADPDAPHAVFGFRGNPLATLPQPGLLKNFDVYVRYDWPQNQKDLDSSTGFLGATAGFDQPGSTYLNWSGDNTSTGGEETTLVNIYSAWVDKAWADTTTVTAAADWYQPSGGSGPALLTVGLEDKISGKLIDVTSKSVNPGFESSGASTAVATINVALGGDPLNPTILLTVT